MKMKKIFLLLILGIFLIGIVNATTNYCCEKTIKGATCQDIPDKTLCSSGSKIISTPCESTSYCATGTCINQVEGTCMSSTEIACKGGDWSPKKKSELPQCTYGCCLMGDSTAFVTQVACNKFPSKYGVNVADVFFEANINDELTCLESANPNVEGACVYSKDYLKTCDRTTKSDCQDLAKSSTYSGVSFHEGYLCSAQELETGCGMSEETRCEGDDVYFVDTCSNLANIYDSSKVNDTSYWKKIESNTTKICETTGNGAGNKDSATCGDCDYYSGSMCQEKKTGNSVKYGNYLCGNLDCENYTGAYSGSSTGYATETNYPRHGETWCSTDAKNGGDSNSPGATSFKLICYNGEVNKPEECDPTRQEICFENDTDTSSKVFMNANCVANLWRDCTAQTKKEDCEDVNARDCTWKTDNEGYYFGNADNPGMQLNETEVALEDSEYGIFHTKAGICVPKYQPGFERDANDEVIGGESCSQATTICYVKMKSPTPAERLFGKTDWKCSENCSCTKSSWETNLNKICTSLGDCGTEKNYIGKFGYAFDTITEQKGSSK
jgi:hypothetical protein